MKEIKKLEKERDELILVMMKQEYDENNFNFFYLIKRLNKKIKELKEKNRRWYQIWKRR